MMICYRQTKLVNNFHGKVPMKRYDRFYRLIFDRELSLETNMRRTRGRKFAIQRSTTRSKIKTYLLESYDVP